MKTILKSIKNRLLIIAGVTLLTLALTLNWVFFVPSVISFGLAHEANEFEI